MTVYAAVTPTTEWKMRFGVCAQPEAAPALKEAGFKFVELNVQSHLVPEKGDAEFHPVLDRINDCALPCSAANCFIPGHLKVTGPDVSMDKLTRYVENACGRALRAGMETIVFGSGGARAIPEGFSRFEAHKQLVEFGKMAAHIAGKCELTIVVEPLNKKECNVLTAVGECADYVREVNHHSFKLLVDSYHWLKDSDSYDDLVSAGHLIAHAHIATKLNRKAPGLEECDFSDFFKALRSFGYGGNVSVEASWNDMEKDAPLVYETLCTLAKG